MGSLTTRTAFNWRLALAFTGAVLVWTSAPALAQSTAAEFPSRPIKIIVSYPPGGGADLLGRFVAKEMSESWGQPVVVDNRSGGGGVIGSTFIAKAPPDGYTFGFIFFAHFVQAAMISNLPFDPVSDFTPITLFANLPLVLCAAKNSGITTFAQLIKDSRSGKRYTFGTSGLGTAGHLGGELINKFAGTHLVHVPYRGAGPIVTDLLGGQISTGFLAISTALPIVRQGKCTPLAVGAQKRLASLPNVPTASEFYPEVEFTEPYSFAGPKGIPRPVVEKLQRELRRIAELPQARDKYGEQLGIQFVANSPDEMAAFLSSSVTKWSSFVRQLGVKQQ